MKAVLVVDDDRINRTLLSTLLEREGYRARTAVDGREALTALSEEPFDAVLLDMVMPEVGGMEVLHTIKSDPRLWRIPVIVISAVEEVDDIVACLDLGADDYVQKPFDPVLLRARLKACLARRQFQDLEVEYQRMLEEQAEELDELRNGRRGTGGTRTAQVAVLSAGLTPEQGPAEALAALAALHAAVAAHLDRFGGVVVERTSTAITVVLEDPGPTTAATMAVSLAEELERRLPAGWGIGVALGDATLGAVGPDASPTPVAVGPVVDRAAALRDRASEARAVLLDEGTAAPIRTSAHIEEVSGPVAAFRLVRLGPPA